VEKCGLENICSTGIAYLKKNNVSPKIIQLYVTSAFSLKSLKGCPSRPLVERRQALVRDRAGGHACPTPPGSRAGGTATTTNLQTRRVLV
jgi:hypothetical protein